MIGSVALAMHVRVKEARNALNLLQATRNGDPRRFFEYVLPTTMQVESQVQMRPDRSFHFTGVVRRSASTNASALLVWALFNVKGTPGLASNADH